MPKNYTVKEVADILGFSTNSIYTFLKEKRLRGVRIGRGRFRIPEEELARVLHLTKKPSLSQPTTLDLTPSAAIPGKDVLTPNIFDWFAGLAAIISGVALFLFNSSLIRPEATNISSVMVFVRIILIASGMGVVGSAMFTQGRGWHKLFHVLLGTLGIVNGVMLFLGGDIDGAIIYGALGVVLWMGVAMHVQGTVLFGIYVSLLAFLFPLWIVTSFGSPAVVTIARVISLSQPWFGVSVILASVSYLVLFWTGITERRPAFIAASILATVLCFGAAVWYGEIQYWSRAFFLIVLGFFSGLVPCWHWFCTAIPRRQRLLLHGLFAGVSGVLLIAVLVVNLLQRNAWEASKTEFFNRVGTAQNILIATTDAARSAAVMTAANPEVIRALEKNNTETLVSASKLLYESNPVIRRVVFLNGKGNGVSLYPYGTFDLANYAFRDYFIQARDTRAVYVSNVFQAAVDNRGRYVLAVAVPVFTSDGTFTGVLVVSVDLERLGLRLRQLAVESRSEYFVITDQKKTILSHPDSNVIGTILPENDLIYSVPLTQKGVAGGILPDGTLALIAYGPVERLGWVVALRIPAQEVYALTQNAVVWVFGIVAAMLIVGFWFASFFKLRWIGRSGGGP